MTDDHHEDATGCPADLDPTAFVTDAAAELRRLAGRHWWANGMDLEGRPMPIVLDFDGARDLLVDRRLSPRSFPDDMVRSGLRPETAYQVAPLFGLHGPDHRRQRRILSVAFTPRRVEAMRGTAAATSARLADDLAADDQPCEFVAAFAEPLPPEVFTTLFGLPVDDSARLARWSTSLGKAFATSMAPDEVEEVEAAAAALRAYATERIDVARTDPGEDLVTTLLQADADGDTLGEEDVIAMMTGFIFAGSETTRRQLTSGVQVLAEHPDTWDRLHAEPELIPNAVEEILRHRSIIPGLTRRTEEPFERADLRTEPGDEVMLSFTTGNHDPDQYTDPDRFDIERANADTHLTFGWGPHHCVGAGLARMEMVEAFRALTARFQPPVVERAGPVTGLLAPDELWVRLVPR